MSKRAAILAVMVSTGLGGALAALCKAAGIPPPAGLLVILAGSYGLLRSGLADTLYRICAGSH
jgi:hypothetical protein